MFRKKFTPHNERIPKFTSNFSEKKCDHYTSKYSTTLLGMSKGSTCRVPNVVPIWGTLGLMSSFEVYCELVSIGKSTLALVRVAAVPLRLERKVPDSCHYSSKQFGPALQSQRTCCIPTENTMWGILLGSICRYVCCFCSFLWLA